ncbi:heavy metal translocating P-type ATPase [Streptobacillus moniliformis]|uniref:heavy metal translocating P-type ATPase n=1 Tax=Streptobacillus moniliformis TaxID=34105 RepID=UPI0007E310F5|nr:heavy metal translocating P-type ATPase [Streptobacillus moniliformis]
MKYLICGIDCAGCASKLEEHLKNHENVKDLSINFATKSLSVDFNVESENNIDELVEYGRKKEKSFDIKIENKSEIQFVEEIEELKDQKIHMFISLALFIFAIFVDKYLYMYLRYDSELYLYYIPLYLFSYAIVAFPIIKDAIKSIKNGDCFNEKVLMMVASLLAIFIREYEEATGVMLFYTLGEYFQEYSVLKSRKGIRSLIDLNDNKVHKLDEDKNEFVDVDVNLIKPGDIFYVKPGEKILLDGKIYIGNAELDTSMITGESLPRHFEKDDEVLAGMINLTKTLAIEASKSFDESSIYKIVEMIENSGHNKSKMEKFVTKFSRYYTPIIFTLAIFITIVPPIFFRNISFMDSLYNGIVLLVIACPCALVLSIPLTFFSGIGRAAKEGILIKGADIFDNIDKIDSVFLDKTGTITEGKFKVNSVFEDLEKIDIDLKEVYEYIYKAEENSNHPIAKSIISFIDKKFGLVDNVENEERFYEYISLCGHCGCCHDYSEHYNKQDIKIAEHEPKGHYYGDECKNHIKKIKDNGKYLKKQFSKNKKILEINEIAGLGLNVKFEDRELLIGNKRILEDRNIYIPEISFIDDKNSSLVYVAIDNVFVSLFVIKDKIKEDTKEAIALMKKTKIKEVVMLTGDNLEAAKEVGNILGIDRIYSNLLPQDKLNILIKEKENKHILFVGDGINDAPVIAAADVGVAMGNMGQDITINTADIVLNTDSLTKISVLKKISSKMKAIVFQNLLFIISIKLIIITFGVFSFMSMWFAVFADVGVTILTVLNAMRMRYIKL